MMDKKLASVPLLLLIALLLAGIVNAQAEITATVSAPEGPFTVGDPIALQVSVTHPTGYQILAPELGEQWGDFIVRSQSPATSTDNGDGTTTTAITLDARLFVPGTFNTPPLAITLTDGAGQLLEVTADPVPVTITSVLVEGDTQLRDIKPQAELPFTTLLPWLAGAVLLALVAGSAYWVWRRRQARLALAAVDNRLPHEIALDELAHIEQMGLPEQGRFKEHYSMVTDTVRRYLESALGVPMMERTTGEIASELAQTALHRATRSRLVNFLEEGDLVKFADIVPSEANAYEMIAQGRMIVEATKPAVINTGDLDGGSPGARLTMDLFSENGQGEKIEVNA